MTFLRPLFLYLGAPAVLGALICCVWSQQTGSSLNCLLLAQIVPMLALAVVVSDYVLATVYQFLFVPYDFFGNEGKDSYLVEKGRSGMSREEIVADMKRTRQPGDFPPVYPNGWFVVCRSTDVGIKGTKYVHMLGLNLAVFRGESGRAYVVDAYCPHLGANLAVGGKVEGECIECPFHGWRYSGEDGKCVKIGYAEKVPNFIKVPTYKCMEANELIMLWFHAEGEEPSWYPPIYDQIKSGQWTRDGGWTANVDCHIQDFVENGGDVPHLDYVHGPQIFQKKYDGHWEVHATEAHRSASISGFQAENPVWWSGNSTVKYVQELHGPGLSFILFDPATTGVMIIACTPVGPLKQRVTFTQFSNATVNPLKRLILRLHAYASYTVVQGDLFIWANKTYKAKPQFIKEDQLIAKHRKWFSQFYTKHSPKFKPRDPLEW